MSNLTSTFQQQQPLQRGVFVIVSTLVLVLLSYCQIQQHVEYWKPLLRIVRPFNTKAIGEHDNWIANDDGSLVGYSLTTTTKRSKATTPQSALAVEISDAIRILQEHGYYVGWSTMTSDHEVGTTKVANDGRPDTNEHTIGTTNDNNNNNNKKRIYDFVLYNNDTKQPIYCSVSKDSQQQQQQTILRTSSSAETTIHPDQRSYQRKQKQQSSFRRLSVRSKNNPLGRILLDDENSTADTPDTIATSPTNTDTNVDEEIENWWILLINGIGVLCCVVIAAIAAGLTVGMLGLDPLMLLIKERASTDPAERIMAQQLLPIIKQRHLLLVTLLIMNSIANETMPIFLEKIVPPAVAVIISVTLVLFFGEIIPSAIFTGPSQVKLASYMIPLVKFFIFILYPIARPIAIDILLSGGGGSGSSRKNMTDGEHGGGDTVDHNDDDGGGGHHDEGFSIYDRHELAALIRIQYEERLVNKRRTKMERKLVQEPYHSLSKRNIIPDAAAIHHSIRNNIESLPQRNIIDTTTISSTTTNSNTVNSSVVSPSTTKNIIPVAESYPPPVLQQDEEWSDIHQKISASIETNRSSQRDSSIELDEVMMVEGALQMKTKCAFDVFTPVRHVYALPASMVLTEKNMVAIYASGYSRIPVYDDSIDTSTSGTTEKKRKYPQSAIIGILVTKVLIVVNPKDQRTVGSLPLRIPRCVSPGTSLVDLINMFQTGGPKGGHQALVCTSPSIGNRALAVPGQCLPEKAGLIGIVTFEDVLEMLLQEEIYDEMDKEQRAGQRLAEMVLRRWKVYTERKKIQTISSSTSNRQLVAAAATSQPSGGNAHINETTALLGGSVVKH